MADTSNSVLTIDVRELGDGFAKALADVRNQGETVDITKDGETLAKLVPVAAVSDEPKVSLFGRGKGVISMVEGGDILDDLFTDDEIEEWYNKPLDPADRYR